MVPLSPTAQTSFGPLPQMPESQSVVPLETEAQAEPFQCTIPSPTAQTSLVPLPQVAPNEGVTFSHSEGSHTFSANTPHIWFEAQVPQWTIWGCPQLSATWTMPQFFPMRAQSAASVSAEQAQRLASPEPPQTSSSEHCPQLVTVRCCPQVSVPVTVPQSNPRRAQKSSSVSGLEQVSSPHWLATLAPQLSPSGQVPQLVTVRC